MVDFILPYKNIHPRIDSSAFIAPGAYVIGDVEIGAQSSIWFGCVVRGDVNSIVIGQRTNIQDLTTIHVTKNGHCTWIGNDVTVGHGALIHAAELRDFAFVGMSCTVMDGAVIEEHGVLAAGALLTSGKRIASGELWSGVPAKKIRDLSKEDEKYFADFATRYVDLKQDYLDQ